MATLEDGLRMKRWVLVVTVAMLCTGCGAPPSADEPKDAGAEGAALEADHSFEPYPGSEWFGPDGEAIPSERVISVYTGHEHCDWQSSTLLAARWPLGSDVDETDDIRVYARDPERLFTDQLLTSFDDDVPMPEGADDTGYRTDFMDLWLDPEEKEAAYLRFSDHVERWPLSDGTIGCD